MLYHNHPQYRVFYSSGMLADGEDIEVSYQLGRSLDHAVSLYYQQEIEYLFGIPTRIVEVE